MNIAPTAALHGQATYGKRRCRNRATPHPLAGVLATQMTYTTHMTFLIKKFYYLLKGSPILIFYV